MEILVLDLLGNCHGVRRSLVRMGKDHVYASLEDLVEHGEDWVPDAASTLLQECTGNLVLLVRVLPQSSEPERGFVFEVLPRSMDMVRRKTRVGGPTQ
eukprot:10389438-Alexandrium_andersonii.AAC.1